MCKSGSVFSMSCPESCWSYCAGAIGIPGAGGKGASAPSTKQESNAATDQEDGRVPSLGAEAASPASGSSTGATGAASAEGSPVKDKEQATKAGTVSKPPAGGSRKMGDALPPPPVSGMKAEAAQRSRWWATIQWQCWHACGGNAGMHVVALHCDAIAHASLGDAWQAPPINTALWCYLQAPLRRPSGKAARTRSRSCRRCRMADARRPAACRLLRRLRAMAWDLGRARTLLG